MRRCTHKLKNYSKKINYFLQILKVNGSNFEHSMTLEKAILSFKSSAFLEIVVKSNLLGKPSFPTIFKAILEPDYLKVN